MGLADAILRLVRRSPVDEAWGRGHGRELLDRGQETGTEWAVITSGGRATPPFQGDQHSVTMPSEIADRSWRRRRSVDIDHNHPMGSTEHASPLSMMDLGLLLRNPAIRSVAAFEPTGAVSAARRPLIPRGLGALDEREEAFRLAQDISGKPLEDIFRGALSEREAGLRSYALAEALKHHGLIRYDYVPAPSTAESLRDPVVQRALDQAITRMHRDIYGLPRPFTWGGIAAGAAGAGGLGGALALMGEEE